MSTEAALLDATIQISKIQEEHVKQEKQRYPGKHDYEERCEENLRNLCSILQKALIQYRTPKYDWGRKEEEEMTTPTLYEGAKEFIKGEPVCHEVYAAVIGVLLRFGARYGVHIDDLSTGNQVHVLPCRVHDPCHEETRGGRTASCESGKLRRSKTETLHPVEGAL